MERFSDNPILTPIEEHAWESREVFNAAAIYLGGKVHLLYRAMGNDNISRLGYATSIDVYKIK
jgi:beta-1,2-mannobiose phosphorylase / 1,2-beta-oligomannan phosphorylase